MGKAVRFIGKEKTRQVDAKWLKHGDIVTDGGLVHAFQDLPDFEVVDVASAPDSIMTVDESDQPSDDEED